METAGYTRKLRGFLEQKYSAAPLLCYAPIKKRFCRSRTAEKYQANLFIETGRLRFYDSIFCLQ